MESKGSRVHYGHDTEDPNKPRTEDVLVFEKVDFESMLLPSNILNGLYSANFKRPSPIQLKAIPLARCGFDLIVQAKSGTGKTLVFGITALEAVKIDVNCLQVLIIAPTREIALQIKDVLCVIGSNMKGLKMKVFIGGIDQKLDKKEAKGCQIAVVTPGRAKQLLDNKILEVENLRLLILDEADKLMEPCFIKDISRIIKKTSGSKQIILASATLCESISKFVDQHMNAPMRVTANGVQCLGDSNDDVARVLVGVKQFVGEVEAANNTALQLRKKADKLVTILKGISFTQCIIFSNYQTRAESLCNLLTGEGWPAVSICGKQEQSQRIAAISAFKEFRCRILLSTDLTARGLDVHGVSLVINLDIPYDSATYLHRMGRAGRFGARGNVITLLGNCEDKTKLRNLLFEIGGPSMTVFQLPADLSKIDDTESLEKVVALPPEDHNVNIDTTEKSNIQSGLAPKSRKKETAQTPSSSDLDGLCNSLLESYIEPRPPSNIRTYEELDSSRKRFVAEGASFDRPILKKKNNALLNYATALSKEERNSCKSDGEVLKTILEKQWTDESRVSSEVDASPDAELSAFRNTSPKDETCGEQASRKQKKKKSKKSVTVNLSNTVEDTPSRNRSSRGERSRDQLGHDHENTQFNSGGDYYSYEYPTQTSQEQHNYGSYANWYQTPPQHNDHRYSEMYAKWYSDWEKQLSHIRFYVEYMEYWRNTCYNSYSNT